MGTNLEEESIWLSELGIRHFSAVPFGTRFGSRPGYPPLKRWAIFGCPSGTAEIRNPKQIRVGGSCDNRKTRGARAEHRDQTGTIVKNMGSKGSEAAITAKYAKYTK